MLARQFCTSFCFLFFTFLNPNTFANTKIQVNNLQEELLKQAEHLLDNAEVSYVYGGSKLGSEKDCELCNKCLEEKDPNPKNRLGRCPECSKCSLDCSHFVQLVYQRSGIQLPYLNTEMMLASSPVELQKKYKLVDVGRDMGDLRPGDLLVYKGHVVMLERIHKGDIGDIIHATGGKDIKLPGQGIQRERWVPLGNFRGNLLRVLRHERLHGQKVFYYGR